MLALSCQLLTSVDSDSFMIKVTLNGQTFPRNTFGGTTHMNFPTQAIQLFSSCTILNPKTAYSWGDPRCSVWPWVLRRYRCDTCFISIRNFHRRWIVYFIYISLEVIIIIGPRDRIVGVWCWRWRASGFEWCVRSQVVGIATRRGARDEIGARPAQARPAQAMRLTANTKRKPWVVSVVEALNNRVYYEGMK